MPQSQEVAIDSSRRTAHQIFERVQENARAELERTTGALAVSGTLGGFTMGLTGLSVAAVRALLPPGMVSEFIALLFYPVGFIAVIIGRAQLFTENTLYPVALVLSERRHIRNTLRLWGTVFGANVLGAFAFGLLAARTTALQPKVADELTKLGMAALAVSNSNAFWSGVVGGWLIALVAWVVSASHWTIGQVAMVWLLTFVVGAGGFAHCIATSGEILTVVCSGTAPASAYLRWLLFATAGNIFGGVMIVSLMNWGQVHVGSE